MLGEADRSLLGDPFDFSAHTLKILSLHGGLIFPSILGLKTLTELVLLDRNFDLHLDTLGEDGWRSSYYSIIASSHI